MNLSPSCIIRLERALSDIGAINAHYSACPNPEYIDLTFELPDMPNGSFLAGAAGFDLRNNYVTKLKRRGFVMVIDNQGIMPVNMSIRDILPANCEDGRTVGIDDDGYVLQWNADHLEIVNSGKTPKQFGFTHSGDKDTEVSKALKPALSSAVYVSSKLKHRDKWHESGLAIISSWIHGQELPPEECSAMWDRYGDEITQCDSFMLYVEPEDQLKGCMLELGMAFAYQRPIAIIWAGTIEDLAKKIGTIVYHESVTILDKIPTNT